MNRVRSKNGWLYWRDEMAYKAEGCCRIDQINSIHHSDGDSFVSVYVQNTCWPIEGVTRDEIMSIIHAEQSQDHVGIIAQQAEYISELERKLGLMNDADK